MKRNRKYYGMSKIEQDTYRYLCSRFSIDDIRFNEVIDDRYQFHVDFYINSHYLQRTGTQSWGQWNSSLPICVSKSSFTTDVYYRNDFDSILIIFLILFIFIIVLPYKIMSRAFGRWLKI